MRSLLINLLLSFVLAVTSVTSAVAHGRMQGAVDLVICSDDADGSALTMITLDASGQPIAQKHSCPDCLAAKGMPALPGLAAPQPLLGRSHALPRPEPVRSASLPAPQALARGPPTLA